MIKAVKNPNVEYKVKSPLRMQVKRAIFKALQSFQLDLPEVYQFQVEQDRIGFLQSWDWKENQRLVVLYLSSVEGNHNESEKANFLLFCAVSPNKNDDTIAFESLNFLADQVRCCLWGCGCEIGFSNILKKEVQLVEYSPFNFKIDLETRVGGERVVSHGIIDFNITYQVKECSSMKEIFGSGIGIKRGGCCNAEL